MRPTLLLTILAALGAGCAEKGEWTTASMCIDVDDDLATCPAASSVDPDDTFSLSWCSADVREITGEGSLTEDPWSEDTDGGSANLLCCYPAEARDSEPGCIVGRPFARDGGEATAQPRLGSGWSGPAMAVDPRPTLAQAWLDVALGEHASIAAFARLTLELMGLGAPADLVAQVQAAAADEVEHATLAFAMVRRFGGDPVEPGPFPVGPSLQLHGDPVDVATAAVREGCVGETVSAWLAERAAERATDPESRRVLSRIAADEARHAALSWQLVGWLVQTFGEPVRAAVVQAFAEPTSVGAMLPGDASLGRFGALEPHEHLALVQRAVDEVLEPAARALLAA